MLTQSNVIKSNTSFLIHSKWQLRNQSSWFVKIVKICCRRINLFLWKIYLKCVHVYITFRTDWQGKANLVFQIDVKGIVNSDWKLQLILEFHRNLKPLLCMGPQLPAQKLIPIRSVSTLWFHCHILVFIYLKDSHLGKQIKNWKKEKVE